MKTRKYKGGQLLSNILETRGRLRSHKNHRYREGIMGRHSEPRYSSSLSLESLGVNARHGESFQVGNKYYSIVKNPETGSEDLFTWDANTDSWSSPSSPRSGLSSPTGSENGRFFGGYKPTKRNLKYLRNYKKRKSIGFTMRSSLKAKGLIKRANGTYKVSKKYRN